MTRDRRALSMLPRYVGDDRVCEKNLSEGAHRRLHAQHSGLHVIQHHLPHAPPAPPLCVTNLLRDGVSPGTLLVTLLSSEYLVEVKRSPATSGLEATPQPGNPRRSDVVRLSRVLQRDTDQVQWVGLRNRGSDWSVKG